MEGHDRILRALSDLKKMGVLLTIDDFGIGYSSLAYLKNFPIDILKIDKVFTDSVVGDPRNKTIIGTIISLSHDLGLKVIAEGVETKEQQEVLRELDCDSLQGYLFAKPAPAEVFHKHYLQKNRRRGEAA